ncbi:hypothetical protein TRFO_12359 [Tritrichomonas foetus]|uniref:PH domain-containing protein n=1 Tax=Tritrichomonas foetus TaxID=1144522 RepID=A0A1J4L632_9EUKA|nr:hypothetical protein TRFO_12359 [Tritrichomonas foetus]|eukprot:OHT17405.1 hypothetical protein TRFO_12359 [Tritrichomonas foetus]
MSSLQDPMVYVYRYLQTLLLERKDFVVLRQSVSRASQLATVKPIKCWCNDRGVLKIGGPISKSFPASSFESIQWGSIESASTGNVKFIVISLKNDRNPIVLHGPTEIMELWYDALKVVYLNAPFIETNSAKNKNEMFTKATTFANVQRQMTVEIPPPPDNYDFVCSLPNE